MDDAFVRLSPEAIAVGRDADAGRQVTLGRAGIPRSTVKN